MRVLAFSPFDPESVSGNATTLRRLREGFRRRGHVFEIATPSSFASASARIASFAPDLVHFYHAFKTGRFIEAAGGLPAVVTLAGTDANHCLEDDDCAPVVRKALSRAARVLTYNGSIAARLPEFRPVVLPKGVALGAAPFDLRAAAGLEPGSFVFLHAGGIREVKGNLAAIDGLAPLRKEVRLVFAGPIHEPAYGAAFLDRVKREPWTRHLAHIPPDAMAAALRGADVVLNTSVSEGISNTIVEAMACGRAILASDVPGNRDLIRDGETGLLGPPERARELLADRALRERLGAAARADAASRFSPEREIDALLAVCSGLLRR